MNCSVCKKEMIESTSEGSKYYICHKCGSVTLPSPYDKK
jgi:DNA-directed RNA polymerase subunit RPC12/RpoP